MLSNHLILCQPLLLLSSIFPSIRVFSKSALCSRWPWSFRFSITPYNEYSGLISLRIDWFDLLAAQGALKSLLQNHRFESINSSVLSLQLSHPYMTTGKINFDYTGFFLENWYLLFNTLSRFVIAFLPRSKHLLISWLLSPSTVILEPRKIKLVTVSSFSPSICHEVMGTDAIILVFECWV